MLVCHNAFKVKFETDSGLLLGWIKVEGKFQHIYSGQQCVIALAGNRDIYYRANVFETEKNMV